MRYLKPFNENTDNFKEELQEFCETNLAYLLDEGTEIQIVEQPGGHEGLHLIRILLDQAKPWNDIKDHFIPFLIHLNNNYEINGKSQFFTNTPHLTYQYYTVQEMIDDKPISQSDLKNINNERLIYDNLIVQSGLNKSKKIPTTIEQTSQEMKDRLGLIVGEIEAGNSNKKLLEELHELLFKMVRVYLISKSAASTYYNNIKKEFFSL